MEKRATILCLISRLDFIKVATVSGDDTNFIRYCRCSTGSHSCAHILLITKAIYVYNRMIRFYPYKDMYQMHMNRSWEKSRSISLIHVLTCSSIAKFYFR